MPYLNLDVDFFSHPKTVRLAVLLGKGSEVLPIRLWAYCAKYHPEDGKLTGCSTQEVEAFVSWWGEKGRMVEAMVKVGFLDEIPSGYEIHDWNEHAGHLAIFKRRAKLAAKERWSRYATSILQANDKQCLSDAKTGKVRKRKVKKREDSEGGPGETVSIAGELYRWPSVEGLVALYNNIAADELPEVTTISAGRRKKAKEYLEQFPKVEFWQEVFKETNLSKFLRGLRSSDGHGRFKGDFDWLLTKGKDGSENCVKTFEGKYRDG